MQVSAVNSTNFGNSYYTDMSEADIRKAEQISRALKQYNDTFTSSEGESKRKSVLGIIASVGVGLAGIFLLTKKGLKGAESIAESIKKDDLAQKAVEKVTDYANKTGISSKFSKLSKTITKSKIVQDAATTFNLYKINYPLGQKATKVVNNIGKLGRDNIIAGATSLGATAYVATTDGDGNGIVDIAEKGVNAYKNALGRIDAIKDFVDLVS